MARGKGSSIFSLDSHARDDLRYQKQTVDKWRLLPAFLQTKGLVKQHLDSFDYFLTTDIKQILHANNMVRSEVDPDFYIKFLDIRCLQPTCIDFNQTTTSPLTPQECRLRDLTYAASVLVDIEFTRGKQIVSKKNIEICRMPIMLR